MSINTFWIKRGLRAICIFKFVNGKSASILTMPLCIRNKFESFPWRVQNKNTVKKLIKCWIKRKLHQGHVCVCKQKSGIHCRNISRKCYLIKSKGQELFSWVRYSIFGGFYLQKLLTCFWRLYIVHLNYIMFIFFIDDSKPAAIHTTHQETSSNTDPQLIHLNTFNHYVLYNNFMVLISTYIFHSSRWLVNGHVFQ